MCFINQIYSRFYIPRNLITQYYFDLELLGYLVMIILLISKYEYEEYTEIQKLPAEITR